MTTPSNTDPQGTDLTQNAEKDPTDWVTGDEPLTGPQRSYLETLAREAGEEAAPGQGHVAAMSRTCSASASEAVRPGDSMPKRFIRPGTP